MRFVRRLSLHPPLQNGGTGEEHAEEEEGEDICIYTYTYILHIYI